MFVNNIKMIIWAPHNSHQLVSTLRIGPPLRNGTAYPPWIIITTSPNVIKPAMYPNIAYNTVMVFAPFQPPNAPHLPFLLMRHPQLPTTSTQQQSTPQLLHEFKPPPREIVMIWRSQQEKESLESPPALYSEQHFAPSPLRNPRTHGHVTITVPTSNQYNQITNDEPMQRLATNSHKPQHTPHRSSAPICLKPPHWNNPAQVFTIVCVARYYKTTRRQHKSKEEEPANHSKPQTLFSPSQHNLWHRFKALGTLLQNLEHMLMC